MTTTYAVTGATGQLGHLVVEELLDRGVPAGDVVAVVRDPARAADLAERGVDVRRGDYSEPDTLGTALAGVQRLLLVSGDEPGQRVAQHTNVVQAAVDAGVQRLVYTSIVKADTSSNPLAAEHLGTEQVIRNAGVPATVLRNSWYHENYTSQLGRYLESGAVVGAAGEGRVSGAARADYAVAAAVALLSDDQVAALVEPEDGVAVLELGGPGYSLGDLAAAVTEVTGTPVAYQDLGSAELAEALEATGLDAGAAAFAAAIDDSIARGDLETDTGHLESLLGRQVTSLADVVRATHV